MPFKSEAQRRFFHAATQPGFRGDADISKKDVKKWEEETPKGKKLPERVGKKDKKKGKKMTKKSMLIKMATDLGRMHAIEKNAGLLDQLISGATKHVGWWAPAAGGAILAGPGYRGEGALAGLLAGRLGARAAKAYGLRGLKGGAKFFEHPGAPAYHEAARQIGRGEAVRILDPSTQKAVATLVEEGGLPAAQRMLRHYGQGGAVGGGLLGGYAAGRLLGAQNPYGMQPVFPGLERENPMGIRPE